MDDQQTVVESSENAMPVAKCASPVKTPSEQVSDSDDDFEDARDAISSSRAVDEEGSNGTAGDDEDLTEDDVIVDYLGKSTEEAEARLAVRRQARAEAREIRMRELERQQKEAEENADRIYDMHPENALRTPPVRTGSSASSRTPVVNSTGGTNYQWSRRSSEDSLEDGATERGSNLRDVRHELKEVDDKFRKAMIQNAQLDNEKASFTYQVELLKDRLEDLEVAHSQLQKEHKEKCRKAEQLKRLAARLKEDLDMCKAALEERDRLIQEQGLVIVGDEGDMDGCEDGDMDGNAQDASKRRAPRKALVSIESAEMLQRAGEGSLDVRLRKFAEERNELMDQIRHLKLELEEERNRHRNGPRTASINGGPDTDMEDVQREANKLLGDYKFKLQKAEQDVSTLQANVARLESQVIRYKTAAETAEKVEDELKSERRRLQREGDGVKDTGTESSVTENIARVCENSEGVGETNDDFWAVIGDDVPKSEHKPSSTPVHQENEEEEELDFWATISTETDILPKRKSVTINEDESNLSDDVNDRIENTNGYGHEMNGHVQENGEEEIENSLEENGEEIENSNEENGEEEIEHSHEENGEGIEHSHEENGEEEIENSHEENGEEIEDRSEIENVNNVLEGTNEDMNGVETGGTSERIEDRNEESEDEEQAEDESNQVEDRSEDRSEEKSERFSSEREKSCEGDGVHVNGVEFPDDENEEDAKTNSEERLKSESLSVYEETAEEQDDSFHTDSEDKSDAENEDMFDDAERINSVDVDNRNGLRRNDSVDFWNVIKDPEEKCPLEYSVGFTLMKPTKKSVGQESRDDVENRSFVNDSDAESTEAKNSHIR